MTISGTYTPDAYTGNGSTTAFPVTFVFFGTSTNAEIEVIERVVATGVESTKVNGTDYTVTGGSGATGTVTAATAPASTVQWIIRRVTTETQETDYVENDPFPAESHEAALDRLTLVAQEATESLTRAIQFPVSYTGGASNSFPEPSASTVIAWNAAANALESGPTTTDITNAESNATAAAASAVAAAASETAAASSETNAANSAASAAASAQGFSGVTLLTASSNDVETTDARTYYQVDASSNTVSVNLPSIGTSNDGLSYTIEVLDVSNAITLVRDGTDTINGVAGNYTGLVEVGQVIQIIADDGTPDNWIVVQASALKVDGTTVELSGRTIQVKDDGITPAKVSGALQAQTGTTYTLVLGDAFKTVTMDNASANVLTVPANSAVAFSTGDRIDIIMKGAGVTTVTFDTGVTGNGVSAGSGALAQYGACSILKVGTDAWLATGLTVA
jgi:hypothetical protein